jgi:Cdc6-like AAA superfamily ATPase
LKHLESFGDVAAEDESVLDYFLTSDAVKGIESNEVFLVLGRKGSGKTALVRFFAEGNQSAFSKSLSLRGYPWNVHAARVDRGASDIEAMYLPGVTSSASNSHY